MDRLSLCRRAVWSAVGTVRRGLVLLTVAAAAALLGSTAWGQLADDPSLPIQERRGMSRCSGSIGHLTESDLLRREDMDKILRCCRADVDQPIGAVVGADERPPGIRRERRMAGNQSLAAGVPAIAVVVQ